MYIYIAKLVLKRKYIIDIALIGRRESKNKAKIMLLY